MAFQASVKVPVLKELLRIVRPLMDEMKLAANLESLTTRVVDPASAAMVDIELSKEAFEEYNSTGVELGIDLDKFREIVGIGKDKDVMSMELDEENNKLKCKVGNVTRRMGLIDTEGIAFPRLPVITNPSSVEVAPEELSKGFKACGWVSERVAITVDEKGLQVKGDGVTDTVTMDLPKEQLGHHDCPKDKSPCKSLFSLGYLVDAEKGMPSTVMVRLEVGTDYPLIMKWQIASGHGEVVYLLAPRIEED